MDGFARESEAFSFTMWCQVCCNLTRTKIPKRFTFRRLVKRWSHSARRSCRLR